MRPPPTTPTLLQFCTQPGPLRVAPGEGGGFELNRRRYMGELYLDSAPKMVIKKAAQTGFSTLAILRAIHRCAYVYPLGVLYLLPTDTHAEKFSRLKIGPLLADNPRLASMLSGTDSTSIKRVNGHGHLCIWGTRLSSNPTARLGLKSFSADELVLDERDEMEDSQVTLAYERMADSRFQRVLELSTPLIPDMGVDASYEASDKRVWMVKCGSCGREHSLELEFPKSLQRLSNGKVIRACAHCRAEVKPWDGRWVAQAPGRDVHGYWVSQLCSLRVDPASILDRYEKRDNLQVLYNDKLGMAYIEATNRLTLADIYSLCGSEELATSHRGPCSMGVDQGAKLHVVIGIKSGHEKSEVVHVGEYRDFEDLDVLMRRFNVGKCVIDGQPEGRPARAFADRNPGKVFLWYHDEGNKHDRPIWNDNTYIVTVNRTVHLDASHQEILQQRVVLPRRGSQALQEFAEHGTRLARKLEDKDRPGVPQGVAVYRWIRTGADHYRQAFSYEALARSDMMPIRPSKRQASSVSFGTSTGWGAQA